MTGSVRRSQLSGKDFRRNRVIALASSLLFHALIVLGLYLYQQQHTASIGPELDELKFGSSGGGGAENANKDAPVEFGPHQATQEEPTTLKSATVQLVRIQIEQDLTTSEHATPIIEKPRPKVASRARMRPRKTIIAENLPIGHVRHGGQGPGSGGGMGGGSGGGIGARYGSSIDWGGEGGRRLLSGRIPKYPEGLTDKQMVVVLQFTVFPDGSVGRIIPVRKTDEYLEHAAIAALQTWRFEALPPQVNKKMQVGKVPFNFKLEQ
jgi:TonB family protein